MDKLIERESAPRNLLVAAPALAVQFFLIPLAVVGVTVLVYVGFRSLLADERKPQDYLSEIRNGGTDRRWPAAYELSRQMADPKVRADRSLAPALVSAFEAARNDDPRVRQYLALAIGRLDPPLPANAVNDLIASLDEKPSEGCPSWYERSWGSNCSADSSSAARISTIFALGSSGDPNVVPHLLPLYESSDAGVRKMVVYALGALPGDAQLQTLRAGLQDNAADVRWNAAVALARHGNADGSGVLRQMLDRDYVERAVKRETRPDEDQDPVADVMISGVRAATALQDASLRSSIETLSQHDRSLKVRQAALEALKVQ
jgi:HEAT repeat protein